MSLSEEEKAKLDAAADKATKDLAPIVAEFPEAMQKLGKWWDEHIDAGHRRLGRLIRGQA